MCCDECECEPSYMLYDDDSSSAGQKHESIKNIKGGRKETPIFIFDQPLRFLDDPLSTPQKSYT